MFLFLAMIGDAAFRFAKLSLSAALIKPIATLRGRAGVAAFLARHQFSVVKKVRYRRLYPNLFGFAKTEA